MAVEASNKRSVSENSDTGPNSKKQRLSVSNVGSLKDDDTLEIWNSINLKKLNIKALYQYIKFKDNSVHIVNDEGYSLLYLAAHNKSIEALRILLLQPNMDVNRFNGPHHELALHAACSKGLFDAVELLIEHGSIVNIKDSLGHTPLTNAIFACSQSCVEFLIKEGGAEVDMVDTQGNNLIHLAAANNFISIIPLLVEKGVNVDQHNQRGLTPLAIAISFGYLDVVDALLNSGADVNGKTKFATALHHAVTWNRLEVIKKLIGLNCKVDVVNALEETPLYLAVQQRKIDIVRFFMEEAKADPCFMPSNPNYTTNLPLLYAANHGYTEMWKLLITPNTSAFDIRKAVDMSKRVGFGFPEEIKDKLDKRQNSPSTLTPTTITTEVAPNSGLNGSTNESKDDEAAFATLFNTFSDDEQ